MSSFSSPSTMFLPHLTDYQRIDGEEHLNALLQACPIPPKVYEDFAADDFEEVRINFEEGYVWHGRCVCCTGGVRVAREGVCVAREGCVLHGRGVCCTGGVRVAREGVCVAREGCVLHGRGVCCTGGVCVAREGCVLHGRGVCCTGGVCVAREGCVLYGRGVCCTGGVCVAREGCVLHGRGTFIQAAFFRLQQQVELRLLEQGGAMIQRNAQSEGGLPSGEGCGGEGGAGGGSTPALPTRDEGEHGTHGTPASSSTGDASSSTGNATYTVEMDYESAGAVLLFHAIHLHAPLSSHQAYTEGMEAGAGNIQLHIQLLLLL
ncbi:unnamed protein product [Closterium sp. Naga37s-1]|nr:unnamed protein product [Closterium sp. Naga37s-1]